MALSDIFKTWGFGLTLATEVYGLQTAKRQAKVSQTQSRAYKLANEAEAQVAENNAQLAEWQAKDALARGEFNVGRAQLSAALLKGSQLARMGGSGVEMGSESFARILTDTDYYGQLDADVAATNADREAWALRMQAQDERNRAAYARAGYVPPAESTSRAVTGTLLGSAGKLLEAFDKWKN